MALMAKDTGGGDFTPVPQGTHTAICNMVVDLGLQNSTYQGQARVRHECFIRWELPNERIEYERDGQKINGPMSIGKTYTLSLGEKANLRKDLEAWRGRAFTEAELKGFDLFNLLGHPCQLSVIHEDKNGKIYANIKSVAGWPKGIAKPDKIENPLLRYSSEDTGELDKLPKWVKDKLDKQVQPERGDPGPTDNGHDLDDDIPF